MAVPNLLCVGSGLTRRYRLNTLQALAMPLGGRIQFRYFSGLIPEGLRNKLERGTFRANVLLGHVDCTKTGRRQDDRCTILPYRYAELVFSRKVGSVFILSLELSEFALTSDLERFQRSLTGDVPHWSKDEKLEGVWCQELPGEFDASERTTSLEDWQTIIKQLRQREDFSKEPYFCTTEGIFKRRTNHRAVLADGEYVLRSDQDYELRIFHFDPDSDAHTGHKPTHWLKLEVTAPWLQIQTDSLLAIDSPYDLKSVHLRSGSTVRQQYGMLVMKDQVNESGTSADTHEQSFEVYLPVKIKGGILRTGLVGVLLGALLAAQQLLVLFSRLPAKPPVLITIAAVILGLGTGLLVAFGVRKPV